MDDDDMDASPDGGVSKRACDSCRTRKIRCDRNVPCSNCRASRLTCKTTAPQQKAQRQRVHISEEYEKKIDRIEDRLAGIENVLANLSSKLGSLDLHKDSHDTSSQSRSSRVGLSRSPGSALQEAHTPAPFEGESSINIQSVYAREMLAQVIDNTPSIGQNEEVKMALTALSEIVSQQGQAGAPGNRFYNRSLAEIDSTQLEKPPWTAVSNALETAMKYPTMAFAVVFPFLRMPNLRDIFYDAYHNPDTCGTPRRMLTYGILENIYTEFLAFRPPDMDVSEYATYAAMCKRQSEVALSQLDLFMPASYENIMALVLGAAQATHMCYHRINTMIHDPPADKESKIYIFWMIYMFDKTLSLRLGRSSVLQDWDISLPFILEITPSDALSHQSRMLSYWVKVARIQGLTYEKLFCPAAFLKSTEERTAIAIDLVNAMNQAWYERADASAASSNLGKNSTATQRPTAIGRDPNETPLPSQYKRYVQQRLKKDSNPDAYIQDAWERVEDIFFHSDVVTHYSTCALIQRSVSPGNMAFNKECLESSREALKANKRAAAQFNKKGEEELWSGYLHWSILQAPFTPFIVIFCHAIQKAATSDVSADLNSLSEFVTSLESCRTISEGLDKLYRMCHLFLRVARFYVLAKRQDAALRSQRVTQSSQPDYYTAADGSRIDLNAMAQFDPYLNALGLLPDPTWPIADYDLNSAGPGGMQGFAQDQTMSNDAHLGHLGQMGLGFGPPGGTQNAMQDWFSSSRYLMNLMEPGDDMQMPDLDL